jgi:hypothetical protein
MTVRDPRAVSALSEIAAPRNWKAVTFDADFTEVSVSIWCGAAGDLYWTAADGTTQSLTGIQAGTAVPVAATKINSASTTIAAASLRYGISGA